MYHYVFLWTSNKEAHSLFSSSAKSTISPPPTDNLGQILNADILFETDGNVR